jgi:hypothetical protein
VKALRNIAMGNHRNVERVQRPTGAVVSSTPSSGAEYGSK